MQHNYETDGTQMIYRMPREVDSHAAEDIRVFLEQRIAAGELRELVFDFSGTEFMDSSGIGVVIGRYRTLTFYKGKVYAQNITERVDKIFRAAGLYRIIEVKEAS